MGLRPRLQGLATAAVLTVLAVAPLATATDDLSAELEATSIRSGLRTDLDASLVIFVAGPPLEGDATLPSGFRLDAERARIEVDSTDATVWTGLTSHGVGGNTTKEAFDDVHAEGIDNRPGHRFIIIPSEAGSARLEARSQCVDITPSDQNTINRKAMAVDPETRAPREVDVSQALHWTDCGDQATLQVTGDFVVALWEWDFQLQGDEGAKTYETGRLPHPAIEDVPHDTSDTVSRDQEAWIFVENGTLTWSIVNGSRHALYAAADGVVESETGFLFRDAGGQVFLDGGQEVEADEVYMDGDLELTFTGLRPGRSIQAQVGGELNGVYVDDEPMWTIAGQSAVSPAGPWWPGAVLVAAGLLLALFLIPQAHYYVLKHSEARKLRGLPGDSWRQRHSSSLIVMARNAFQLGRPRRALFWARASTWFHNHPQAHIARADAYGDLGRPDRVHGVHLHMAWLLQGDVRESCRNAWHAYRSLRVADPERATYWYRRARSYDVREAGALGGSAANPRTAPDLAAVPT